MFDLECDLEVNPLALTEFFVDTKRALVED